MYCYIGAYNKGYSLQFISTLHTFSKKLWNKMFNSILALFVICWAKIAVWLTFFTKEHAHGYFALKRNQISKYRILLKNIDGLLITLELKCCSVILRRWLNTVVDVSLTMRTRNRWVAVASDNVQSRPELAEITRKTFLHFCFQKALSYSKNLRRLVYTKQVVSFRSFHILIKLAINRYCKCTVCCKQIND